MRLVLFALLFVACAEDVAKDKTAAVVSEPNKVEAPVEKPAPAAPADVRTVDPARSSIKALGAKVTGQHTIEFPTFTGTVSAAGAHVNRLEFTVQVADLKSDPEKLVTHLLSPDFFDVAQFPTATFQSSSVVAGEGSAHTVSGALTLRGVTKELTFPATLETVGGEIKGHAEFAINRQDFGIVYPGKPDNLIQDNVVLTIDLVAIKPVSP